tara:strand:- start:108 stop:818 length:711 start_codon:yes stop_codon:yes gene_type:complete
MQEVTILGNGPSRVDFDFSSVTHEVWGCNAIHRDTNECDIVFAVDMPVQKELVTSDYYRGNLVAFADIDPLPIELFGSLASTMEGVCEVNIKDDDTHFIIQGDGESTDFLGLIRPDLIVTYNDPMLRNLFTGMSALGFAMDNGYERVNLIGFDALEGDNFENIYEGSVNYMHKYNTDSRVLNAQRSQFIALLREYNDCSVYLGNPLDKGRSIKYNELSYYEVSEEWILGQGLKSLI